LTNLDAEIEREQGPAQRLTRQPELAETAGLAPRSKRDMFRMLAAQEMLARREALLRGLRQRGALIVEATPESLASGVVDRYLEVKERGLI